MNVVHQTCTRFAVWLVAIGAAGNMISKITNTVSLSSVTLNPAIPYHTSPLK